MTSEELKRTLRAVYNCIDAMQGVIDTSKEALEEAVKNAALDDMVNFVDVQDLIDANSNLAIVQSNISTALLYLDKVCD